jgi:hypothetical protein
MALVSAIEFGEEGEKWMKASRSATLGMYSCLRKAIEITKTGDQAADFF